MMLSQLLFKEECLICNEPLENGEDFCAECVPAPFCPQSFANPSTTCPACGELSPSMASDHCLACHIVPLIPRFVRSAGVYSLQAEELLKVFKYRRRRRLASLLATDLYRAVPHRFDTEVIEAWDLVLPLPSSFAMLQQRAFSHTGLLAKGLALKLRKPYSLLALSALKNAPQQARRRINQRREQVAGRMTANPRLVSKKQILLIDDLLTTGASIDAAAVALYGAGATSVDVLTLFRSSGFQRNRFAAHHSKDSPSRFKTKRIQSKSNPRSSLL